MIRNDHIPPCKHCGETHGMGIENRETGVIEPIDVCYNCLWFGSMIPINEKVVLSDDKDGK